MFDFLKNSIRELKHVVWPTRSETKKYFIVVVNILVLFGLYLFLASTLFSELIFNLNKIFNGGTSSTINPISESSIIVNTGSVNNESDIIINTSDLTNSGSIDISGIEVE